VTPRRSRLAALLFLAVLAACSAKPRDAATVGAGAPVGLEGGVGRLRNHFNAHRELPRAVLLLSPT